MIRIHQVQNGLGKYVECELVPHLSGIKKIGLSAYAALASKNLGEVVMKYKDHPAVAVLHIINDEGEVNVDALRDALFPLFAEKQTIEIPLIGDFTFDQNDIEKLCRYMKGDIV